MARRATIEDDDLICKLTDVFRNVGYDGASLAVLADATGLKKASLYHRFPGGKEQMAEEVFKAKPGSATMCLRRSRATRRRPSACRR